MRNIGGNFRSTTGALLATSAILGIATSAYGQTAPEYGRAVNEPDPDQLNVAAGENITGAQSGVLSRRNGLTVNNAGTIRGNGTRDNTSSVPAAGISIDEGDNVINNSGTISGAGFGITTLYYIGTPGGPLEPRAVNTAINNSGTISGDINDGIRLIGGGSVTNRGTITGGSNLSGGLSGADGISMFFLDGQNAAALTGVGTVSNQAGGTISGDRFGIILSGGGVVNNAGTLQGDVAGLLIQSAPQNPSTGVGTVINSGTVIGANGVLFGGVLSGASLLNSGSITGTGEYGIASRAAGPVVVENAAAGAITGTQSGILSEGAALTINNSGLIRGNGTRNDLNSVPAAGISIAVGDNVVNNSGTISGAGFGITTLFYKNPLTGVLEPRAINTIINNSGSIIGDSRQAVRLTGGGTVTNSGIIRSMGGGLADGVGMSAFVGQDMTGRSGLGTVINQIGGQISGARIGIILSGGGTVDNAGSITGATFAASGLRGLGAAVVIQSSAADGPRTGLVTNSGQLQGGVGFMTAGFLPSATLNNSGTVTGLAGPGVMNLAGGTVTVNNSVGGSITGATSGIYGEEGAVIVNNDGVIRGNGNYDGFARAPDAGIGLVQSGSSVVNRGTISGAGAGITTASYFNAAANRLEGRANNTAITNSGTISGESNDGVRLIGGGTVTNSGIISGNGGPLADGVSMFFFDDQDASSSSGVGTVDNAAGGTISGDRFGIILSGGGTINNAGSLLGGVAGVLIQSSPLNAAAGVGTLISTGDIVGGVVMNVASGSAYNSGSITSSTGTAFTSLQAITLTNAGRIAGGAGTAVQFGDGDDTLLLRNGSQIEGIVDGGLGLDTATLEADATSVLDLGPFINFERLEVEGGTWLANGATGSFDAISVSDGRLAVTGTLAGNLTTTGAGIFEIGNGGTSGSFTGNLQSDGAFVFNRSDDFDFEGDFSGTGVFTKLGAGTLSFLGEYAFSGTTSLLEGGIRIAGTLSPDTKFQLSGGTLDLSGSSGTTIAELSGTENATIVLGGMADLTINQESNTTFAGNISGDGSLIKTGDGRLNLTGDSTYTGETIIGGGILSVNGSVISDITIQSGAVLGGTGTTGDVTIQQGGAFNPGNSIGTIKVVGGLVFASGSAYQVEVDANGLADRINVAGAVKINDGVTVNVLAADGNYRPSTKYLILTASDKISGRFSAVSTDLAFLDAKLEHSSKKVELLLKRNDVSFAEIAKNSNQANVANAVEALGQTNLVYEGVLSQNVQGAQNAFGILSGSFFGDLSNRLVSSGGSMQSTLLAPPDHTEQGINSWSAYGRTNQALGSLGYQSGVSVKRGGLTASIASGFISAERIANGASGDADMATNFIGGNIAYAGSGLKANVGVGFGWHDIEVRRNVVFAGFGEGVDSRFKASTRQVFGELSYAHANGPLLVQPYAGVSNVNLRMNMITEVGGSSSLRANLLDRSISTGTVGLRASAQYKLSPDIIIAPKVDFAWQHSLGDLAAISQSRFGRSNTNFAIEGQSIGRGGMKIDAGLAITMGPVSLSASYRQTSAFDAIDDGAKLTLGVRF